MPARPSTAVHLVIPFSPRSRRYHHQGAGDSVQGARCARDARGFCALPCRRAPEGARGVMSERSRGRFQSIAVVPSSSSVAHGGEA
eukprot:3095498-Prymnesium_polylepis.2